MRASLLVVMFIVVLIFIVVFTLYRGNVQPDKDVAVQRWLAKQAALIAILNPNKAADKAAAKADS